jgi:dephospho-CoA kinase
MLKIGLTGGMGSGKTLVGEIFKLLNIPVFNADQQAKDLYNEEFLKTKLKNLFGDDVYKDDSLDKQKLARIIFRDKNALQELNQLVHPLVWDKFQHWSDNYHHLPYVIHEAAILLESGGKEKMDHVVYVHAPEQKRVERIIKRDGMEVKDIKKRMENQMDDKKKEQLSDYMVINDNTRMVIPQVIKIHEDLIRKLNNY